MNQVEHTHLTQQEQLSALHDGQLSSADALALVRASLADESLMQQWRSMSAASHVLRDGGYPPLLQPNYAAHAAAPVIVTTHAVQAASNDSRWKMVAGFAMLAAVGSLVWGLLGASGAGVPQGAVLAGNTNSNSPPVMLVNAPSSGAVSGQEIVMIRNPRLDEFLAAHKQFGGVSALQQPAGSLRNVSVDAPRP